MARSCHLVWFVLGCDAVSPEILTGTSLQAAGHTFYRDGRHCDAAIEGASIRITNNRLVKGSMAIPRHTAMSVRVGHAQRQPRPGGPQPAAVSTLPSDSRAKKQLLHQAQLHSK